MAGDKEYSPAPSPNNGSSCNASEEICMLDNVLDSQIHTDASAPGFLNINAQEFIPIKCSPHSSSDSVLGSLLNRHRSLDSASLSASMSIPLNHQSSLPTSHLGALISPPTSSLSTLARLNRGDESPEETKVKFNANDPKFTEVKAAILKQVEFYFGDKNLPMDVHLLKLMKRNPDGFVPLKTISEFNKMKSIISKEFSSTMSIPLMTSALRESSTLNLSKNGKSVRRIHPLPEVNAENAMSCTVLAENLPEDHSIEALEKLFGTSGRVKMVRVCQPNSQNGSSQLSAKYKGSDLAISNKLHALIEYHTSEEAKKAVHAFRDSGDWRNGLKVHFLNRSMANSKTKKGHAHNEESDKHDKHTHDKHIHDKHTHDKHTHDKHIHDKHTHDRHAHDKDGQDKNAHEKHSHEKNHVDPPPHQHQSQHQSQHHSSPMHQSSPITESDEGHRGGSGSGMRIRGRGKGRGSNHHHAGKDYGSPYSSTPPRMPSGSPIGSFEFHAKLPPGPRMPDGTRGFAFGRGKKLEMTNQTESSVI